jgi:hypothetical protein
MGKESQHVAPADPRRRRRTTRVVLGTAVVATLGASGIYIATAGAQEVAAPGTLQAEAYAAQSGARTENTSDAGGGKNVGWLATGDWLEYRKVTIAAPTLTARIAGQNGAGGSIEARLGSRDGALLATFPVTATGGWQKWKTVTAEVAKAPSGPQTLVLVMKSTSRSDFVNINWINVGAAATVTPPASGTPTAATPTATKPATTAPTSAAPSSAAPSNPSATPGGWVPVDEAAWQETLALHKAVPPKTVPAGIVRVPEFHTNCTVANEAPDDPIVLPKLAGASHLHTFFGPKVNANTTPEQLRTQPTTCDAAGDNSAYWAPTLLLNGKPVKMKNFRAYYGAKIKDPATVKPFPPGLVMVQGDAKRQVATPKGASGQFWCAGSA